ncbi:hypothetical protein F5146DRAFT_167633 [Armillaria mellea]|nr:hypothetical protein F5146DRAFT_167633 [Armillaria mellea]
MSPKLFQATNDGFILLKHPVVLAPMTHLRASTARIPIVGMVKEYYEQRAHTPGTLLITGVTLIGGKDQIVTWKEISNAVHAKGPYIFCRLYVLGRAADPKVRAYEGH